MIITIWNAIGAASDQIVAISTAIMAIFAFLGLKAWREQIRGAADYEKAKQILRAVYKVREMFKYVRSAGVYEYEYPPEMKDSSGHLKSEFDYEGNLHVYTERLKKFDPAFSELEELAIDAQVHWGAEYQEIIKQMRGRRIDLLIALQGFLDSKKAGGYRRLSPEESQDIHYKMYYIGEDSKHDPFTKQINAAVKLFEDKLCSIIGR